MNPHLIIISHRRSGTHLTIDSIWNNVKAHRGPSFINLDQLSPTHREPIQLNSIQRELETGPRILKTHCLPDLSRYIHDHQTLDFLEEVFESSNKLYVYRDGRDVMVSLFHYMKTFSPEIRSLEFSQFLKTANNFDPPNETSNRVSFWKFHIEAWQKSSFSRNLFFVQFENWIARYEDTLREVARNFEWTIKNPIADLRLFSDVTEDQAPVRRTSVHPRRGRIGDWRMHFDDQSTAFFAGEAGDKLEELGYK